MCIFPNTLAFESGIRVESGEREGERWERTREDRILKGHLSVKK